MKEWIKFAILLVILTIFVRSCIGYFQNILEKEDKSRSMVVKTQSDVQVDGRPLWEMRSIPITGLEKYKNCTIDKLYNTVSYDSVTVVNCTNSQPTQLPVKGLPTATLIK